MTLPISRVIRVGAEIAGGGIARRDFGRTLVPFKAGAYSAGETASQIVAKSRIQVHANLAELGAYHSSTTEIYKLAEAYFGQDPFPKPMVVAPHYDVARGSSTVVGGDFNVADAVALGNGVRFKMGAAAQSSAIDFRSLTSKAAVASALNTAFAGSVRLSEDRLVFSHTTDLSGALTSATDGFAAALGLDNAVKLGLQTADATLADGLNRIQRENNTWYFISLPRGSADYADADALALSSWAETKAAIAFVDDSGAAALTANETASLAAQLHAGTRKRTACVWSLELDYKAASLAAAFSSADFGARGIPTGAFTQLPGRKVDDITEAQADELDRKNCNYYASIGDGPVLQEGEFSGGGWIDTTYGLDWMKDAAEKAAYNVISTSQRVPMTDAGVASVVDAVAGVLEQAVTAGIAAPGTLPAAPTNDVRTFTGNIDFDGFLPTGYTIHAKPVSSLTAGQRAERKMPPVRAWVYAAGAVQQADFHIVLFE